MQKRSFVNPGAYAAAPLLPDGARAQRALRGQGVAGLSASGAGGGLPPPEVPVRRNPMAEKGVPLRHAGPSAASPTR